MATIRKRGNSYQIRVSCGYDTMGNQVTRNKTWIPEEGLTAKQIEKELNRQAVMFEESCNSGFQTTVKKFQNFAEDWFREYAETKLKTQTVRCYHNCEKKVYERLGHLRNEHEIPDSEISSVWNELKRKELAEIEEYRKSLEK